MEGSRITVRAQGLGLGAFAYMAAACVALLLNGCQLTDHTEKDPNAITAESLNIPASGYTDGDTTQLPRFAFDSTTVHFGKVSEGTQVERTYRFTNVGKSNLIITDVRGTCGCTVGKEWPKQPVKPGEGGSITVRFDSQGRGGVVNKTISVTSNTQPPTTTLVLSGEVVVPPGTPVVE
jgi:Protein of unknown function (DUF1573)